MEIIMNKYSIFILIVMIQSVENCNGMKQSPKNQSPSKVAFKPIQEKFADSKEQEEQDAEISAEQILDENVDSALQKIKRQIGNLKNAQDQRDIAERDYLANVQKAYQANDFNELTRLHQNPRTRTPFQLQIIWLILKLADCRDEPSKKVFASPQNDAKDNQIEMNSVDNDDRQLTHALGEFRLSPLPDLRAHLMRRKSQVDVDQDKHAMSDGK
jgi:hypothetical protein